MIEITLEDQEARLIQELLDERSPQVAQNHWRPMRAAVIRCLLLHIPVNFPGEAKPRVVQLPEIGVRFVRLIVSDAFDLTDAIGPMGNALSPLMLKECLFLGGIRLVNARLRELSFEGSYLTHIDARGITVEGTVNLRLIAAVGNVLSEQGKREIVCSADLSGATIKDDFLAQGANLVLQAGASGDVSALNLQGATIRGDCFLGILENEQGMRRFEAHGGVNISLCEIGGNVILGGALLRGGNSLRMIGAHVNGGVSLSPIRDNSNCVIRFEAYGSMNLTGLRVDLDLKILGAKLDAGAGVAVNLSNAEIGGLLDLRGYGMKDTADYMEGREPIRLQVTGMILIVATRVKFLFRIMGVDSVKTTTLVASEESSVSLTNETKEDSPLDIVNLLTVAACHLNQVQLSDINAPSISFQSSRVALSFEIEKIKTSDLDLTDMDVNTDLGISSVVFDISTGTEKDTHGDSESNLPQIKLQAAKIGGQLGVSDLSLGPNAARMGRALNVDLTGCRTGLLEDDENAKNWGKSTLIIADGFTYEVAPKRSIAGHLAWLRLQHASGAPIHRGFAPSVYNYLAKVLRQEGLEDEADSVLSEKLTVEKIRISKFAQWRERAISELDSQGKARGTVPPLRWLELLFLGPYWFLRWIFWILAHFCFDYGLSQVRTLSTFVILVAFGWGATYIADHGVERFHIEPVLVVETSTVNTVAMTNSTANSRDSIAVGLPRVGAGSGQVLEIPCGQRIEPLPYAFTAFVPILDLHQDRLCEISEEPRAQPWRRGRFIYSLLGWIVSSVTLLTLPGFLRAKAEE